MIINEKRWKEMPDNERTWIIYDTLQYIDKRLTRLERRNLIHKAFAFAGGIIGGAATFLGISITR
jgi:hypothetical protein